jgi:hypothetical protein
MRRSARAFASSAGAASPRRVHVPPRQEIGHASCFVPAHVTGMLREETKLHPVRILAAAILTLFAIDALRRPAPAAGTHEPRPAAASDAAR